MRAMRLVLALVLLAALAPGAAADPPFRKASRTYERGVGELASCASGDPDDATGGVCFALAGDELDMGVTARDAADVPAAIRYHFVDPAQRVMARGSACASADGVTVPPGAVELVVSVAVASASTICPPPHTGGAATGTISVVWRLVTLKFTSPSFAYGARIPDRHTCAGEDVSRHSTGAASPTGRARSR